MLFLRIVEPIREAVDLLSQVILALAGRLQLFLDGLPLVGVEVGRLDSCSRRRSGRGGCPA